MRIETNTRTNGVSGRSAAGRSGSGVAFVPAGEDNAVRTAAAAPMSASTGIDAILALQSVEDPTKGKKKRAVSRGASLLDTLDAIKADLLVGQVSAERLDQLMAMLGQAREHSTPELDAVLDDIELRVRVELAKLGRFT